MTRTAGSGKIFSFVMDKGRMMLFDLAMLILFRTKTTSRFKVQCAAFIGAVLLGVNGRTLPDDSSANFLPFSLTPGGLDVPALFSRKQFALMIAALYQGNVPKSIFIFKGQDSQFLKRFRYNLPSDVE